MFALSVSSHVIMRVYDEKVDVPFNLAFVGQSSFYFVILIFSIAYHLLQVQHITR